MTLQSPPPPLLLNTYKQNDILLTPERSVPSSPTLSSATAVVTHTNATTKHLHTNDDSITAVDFNELTRLLHNVVCSSSSQKKKSSLNSNCSSSSNSSVSSSSTSTKTVTNSTRRRSSCLNPNNTPPPQFIFKKPLYNQHYHQTHFHHHSSSSLLTPTQTNHSSCQQQQQQQWIDLKRFFNTSQQQLLAAEEQPFANQFRQNISTRYGQWGKFIGKGAGGSVRLIHSKQKEQREKVYAVKQFRTRFPHETEKEYIKKVTAEFCIGSTLHHENIIETLDLIQEENSFYQIMEYAPNDLFNVVMSGMMSREEIACCWRQLLNGVHYLHSSGIVHRDLKLDNLVLDHMGILKIIDFGCSTVFKYPFESAVTPTKGIFGSDPYIAPEQYVLPSYDPRLCDIWSCGIIFVCMTIKRFPWRLPRNSDPAFRAFATNYNQQKFRLLKLLPRESRSVMTSILEVDPTKRYSITTILKDDWVKSIDHCTVQEPGLKHVHHVVNLTDNSRGNLVATTNEPPGVVAEKEKRKRLSQH